MKHRALLHTLAGLMLVGGMASCVSQDEHQRAIALAEMADVPVYIVHLSAAEALHEVTAARDRADEGTSATADEGESGKASTRRRGTRGEGRRSMRMVVGRLGA